MGDPVIDELNARLDWLESTAARTPQTNGAEAESLAQTDVNDADFDMKQGDYLHPVNQGGMPCSPVDALLKCPVALFVRQGCDKSAEFEERIRKIAEPQMLLLDALPPLVQLCALKRLEELTGSNQLPRVFIHGKWLKPPANDIHRVDLGPRIHTANLGCVASLMNKQTEAAGVTYGLCSVKIDFEGVHSEMQVDSDRWMGGIFKSKLMSHLDVKGRLSDFVVTCGGESFRGREPISVSPHFHPGCTVCIHRRSEDEAKPQGTS